MGDVKTVANGYARNYLFPRSLALPYNDVTVAWFEGRKEEIEARKQAKREASASLKEKLSAHTVTIVMTAGQNGKLYGAVTSQTVADALAKDGFEIERKRIDIPGVTVKSVGKYTVTVRLYESETAEFPLIVEAQKEAEMGAAQGASGKTKKERKNDEAPETKEAEAEQAEQAENEEAVEQPAAENIENTDEAAGSENAAE